jgi:hypothetical protein
MQSMDKKDLRDGISRPRKSVSMKETKIGLHERKINTVSTFVIASDRMVKLMPRTKRIEYATYCDRITRSTDFISTSEQHHAATMSNVVTVTCRSVTVQGAGKTIIHALLKRIILDDTMKYPTNTDIDVYDHGSGVSCSCITCMILLLIFCAD